MKKNAKKAKAAGPEMPGLVTAMMKLVERLEVLEKKTDLVLGRISNLPMEMRQSVQGLQCPDQSHLSPVVPHQGHSSPPNPMARERILYQAICSDCRKSCEVPFKPTGERPVYCKECFTIRKAGHIPKDLTSNVVVPQRLRNSNAAPRVEDKAAVPPPSKKPVPKAAKKPVKKKKK